MKWPRLLTVLIVLCNIEACDRVANIKTADVIKSKEGYRNDFKYATSMVITNRDSAFYYFNKITIGSKDSLLIAGAYSYMGIIQNDAGDYFGGQESLLSSLKFLDERRAKDRPYLLSSYNELGLSSLSLKNYNAAINYFDDALKFMNHNDDRITTLNNKAVAYQRKKEYTKALDIYQDIINDSIKNNREYARILSNTAKTKWLQDPGYRATPDLWLALQIRKNETDDWGLNASYGHLADYYAQSRPDSALYYANALYDIARKLESPDDELDALQKLITLSPPGAAKKNFERYRFLNDSLQTTRNSAKNQFALIRYNVEKNKTENLILQKDNAEKKSKIIQQWVMLILIIILAASLLLWYRRKKQRQQLKTSQKVHDVVANGLYRIMAEIENKKVIEKEPLLDKMEQLYEQSRNISYEQPEIPGHDFQKAITELLESFATETTSISIVGNNREIWDNVPMQAQTALSHVLQELLTNMKKHSQAKNVVIKFNQQEKDIRIQYIDDGVGLPDNFKYGNGLSSTETRINSIGGRTIFESSPNQGLKIQIFIPIV